MPVTYFYDPETNILTARPSGVITVPEAVGYLEEVAGSPQVPTGFLEVVHFDEVQDFAFSFAEAGQVLSAYRALVSRKQIRRTVFVVKNSLSYGIARMFSTALHDIGDLRVVQNEDQLSEALADVRDEHRPSTP